MEQLTNSDNAQGCNISRNLAVYLYLYHLALGGFPGVTLIVFFLQFPWENTKWQVLLQVVSPHTTKKSWMQTLF